MKAWAKSFYLSAAWEKTRAAYLMSQDYICERCGQPAKIVHHKRWLNRENIAALDERLKRVESGWGIDYKHDAVLGLCYMGAAYMSQHYERTVETAVLGVTYVGNSYLANTF